MTRILETKAATRLLKATFVGKGVTLKQNEALDLLAKLQGYEAWSHLQSSLKKKPKAQPVPVAPVLPKGQTFQELLHETVGAWKNVPDYPRKDWSYEVENNDTSHGYFDWVASQVTLNSEIDVEGVRFHTPRIQVQDARGTPCIWNIEQNLTTRDGELNDVFLETKPGLALLLTMADVLAELQGLMVGEDTFVVRKDGKFGILFEIEYCSQESEAEGDVLDMTCKPHAVVVEALKKGLLELEVAYPEIEFCIPPTYTVVKDRPAVWGYASRRVANTMFADELQELAAKLARL